MHEGVPPGGALVPELLARANAAAGNAADIAAIEVFGELAIEAASSIVVGVDDGTREELQAGDAFVVACRGQRVRYLAVRGGIDVPVVLGGRGTLLAAAFGGYEGRAVRKGDVVRAGDAPVVEVDLPPLPPEGPLVIVPGPDLHRFDARALDLLLAGPFVVDVRSDRTGVRLSGPPLPRIDDDTGVSTPMIRGAIQVPPSGGPVILGPDHPTTGGYPVLATVARSSLGALGAVPVGAAVRFRTQRATPSV
jgi:allophanate hydrolase subunit 2